MQSSQRGFTLVELIVVILLVSILSVYAASRYSGVSSISAYAAQEQAISIIRQIQIDRMQSNLSSTSTNSDYVLAIQSNCLGSVEACSEDSDDQRSDVLRSDNLTFSTSPSYSVIEFSLLGNPSIGSNENITIMITAPGSETAICINAQGYVSRGACS